MFHDQLLKKKKTGGEEQILFVCLLFFMLFFKLKSGAKFPLFQGFELGFSIQIKC